MGSHDVQGEFLRTFLIKILLLISLLKSCVFVFQIGVEQLGNNRRADMGRGTLLVMNMVTICRGVSKIGRAKATREVLAYSMS